MSWRSRFAAGGIRERNDAGAVEFDGSRAPLAAERALLGHEVRAQNDRHAGVGIQVDRSPTLGGSWIHAPARSDRSRTIPNHGSGRTNGAGTSSGAGDSHRRIPELARRAEPREARATPACM